MAELTPELQAERKRLVEEIESLEETFFSRGTTTSRDIYEKLSAWEKSVKAKRELRKFDKRHTSVKVEIEPEFRERAKVLVYEDGRLVAEVTAKVEMQQDADGGWYHRVTLKKR